MNTQSSISVSAETTTAKNVWVEPVCETVEIAQRTKNGVTTPSGDATTYS